MRASQQLVPVYVEASGSEREGQEKMSKMENAKRQK